MLIAVTGATGFVGRAVVAQLCEQGRRVKCWARSSSDVGGLEPWQDQIEWLPGQLGNERDAEQLIGGCDAVVHAALWRPGAEFRGGEGDLLQFVQTNLIGSLQLMEAARTAGVQRFVFVSTCAVHERILDDRPLDEAHPLWPTSHYGAHKAALEKFVHSYGWGHAMPICSLRPTGIYGVARPASSSKWYELTRAVVRGEAVQCRGGGKEVHVDDVAKAADLLLTADGVSGESYNCYDMYISQYDVAHIARDLSGSRCEIVGEQTRPKHDIVNAKIRSLGMQFGGRSLLERTIGRLIEAG